MTAAGSLTSWSLVVPCHLFRDTLEAPSIFPSVLQEYLVPGEGRFCVYVRCVHEGTLGVEETPGTAVASWPWPSTSPGPWLVRGLCSYYLLQRSPNSFTLKLLPRPLLSCYAHGHPAPGSLHRQISP